MEILKSFWRSYQSKASMSHPNLTRLRNYCMDNDSEKNQFAARSCNTILKNTQKLQQGVYIGTPSTGLVRMEWAVARFSQIIPCNWGYKQAINWMPSCSPLGYLVADAQNLIIRS